MALGKRRARGWAEQVDAGRMDQAHVLLFEGFPPSMRETYLRGKTEFRDFLYEKMGCSLLEAELLVDVLEKKGRIAFQRFGKGMRYGMWEIRRTQ